MVIMAMKRRPIPQCIDPPMPDRRRVLPGGLVLGENDENIQNRALENRASLEHEPPFPGYFVARLEDHTGAVLGVFVIHAERMYDAITKVESDVGRYMWLSNGDKNHQVGIPQIALSCNLVRLERVRKENIFL